MRKDGAGEYYKTRVTVDHKRMLLLGCKPLEVLAALAYDTFQRKLNKQGQEYNFPASLVPEVCYSCLVAA